MPALCRDRHCPQSAASLEYFGFDDTVKDSDRMLQRVCRLRDCDQHRLLLAGLHYTHVGATQIASGSWQLRPPRPKNHPPHASGRPGDKLGVKSAIKPTSLISPKTLSLPLNTAMPRRIPENKDQELRAWTEKARRRDVDAARSILFYFCDCVQQKKPISPTILEHLADAFNRILVTGEKSQSALGLVKPKHRKTATVDYRKFFLGACAWVNIHDVGIKPRVAFKKVGDAKFGSPRTVSRAYEMVVQYLGTNPDPNQIDEIRAIANSPLSELPQRLHKTNAQSTDRK